MDTIPRICEAMQRVLTRKAEALGRATGFVRRASKVSGSILAKTLVFGWLKNPKASLGELTQTTAVLGVRVSPQGLEQRLGQAAARLLKAVLDEGVNQLVATEPVAVSVLQRFNPDMSGLDSSTVVLPDALGTVWPGCGGSPDRNRDGHCRISETAGGCGPVYWSPRGTAVGGRESARPKSRMRDKMACCRREPCGSLIWDTSASSGWQSSPMLGRTGFPGFR